MNPSTNKRSKGSHNNSENSNNSNNSNHSTETKEKKRTQRRPRNNSENNDNSDNHSGEAKQKKKPQLPSRNNSENNNVDNTRDEANKKKKKTKNPVSSNDKKDEKNPDDDNENKEEKKPAPSNKKQSKAIGLLNVEGPEGIHVPLAMFNSVFTEFERKLQNGEIYGIGVAVFGRIKEQIMKRVDAWPLMQATSSSGMSAPLVTPHTSYPEEGINNGMRKAARNKRLDYRRYLLSTVDGDNAYKMYLSCPVGLKYRPKKVVSEKKKRIPKKQKKGQEEKEKEVKEEKKTEKKKSYTLLPPEYHVVFPSDWSFIGAVNPLHLEAAIQYLVEKQERQLSDVVLAFDAKLSLIPWNYEYIAPTIYNYSAAGGRVVGRRHFDPETMDVDEVGLELLYPLGKDRHHPDPIDLTQYAYILTTLLQTCLITGNEWDKLPGRDMTKLTLGEQMRLRRLNHQKFPKLLQKCFPAGIDDVDEIPLTQSTLKVQEASPLCIRDYVTRCFRHDTPVTTHDLERLEAVEKKKRASAKNARKIYDYQTRKANEAREEEEEKREEEKRASRKRKRESSKSNTEAKEDPQPQGDLNGEEDEGDDSESVADSDRDDPYADDEDDEESADPRPREEPQEPLSTGPVTIDPPAADDVDREEDIPESPQVEEQNGGGRVDNNELL